MELLLVNWAIRVLTSVRSLPPASSWLLPQKAPDSARHTLPQVHHLSNQFTLESGRSGGKRSQAYGMWHLGSTWKKRRQKFIHFAAISGSSLLSPSSLAASVHWRFFCYLLSPQLAAFSRGVGGWDLEELATYVSLQWTIKLSHWGKNGVNVH